MNWPAPRLSRAQLFETGEAARPKTRTGRTAKLPEEAASTLDAIYRVRANLCLKSGSRLAVVTTILGTAGNVLNLHMTGAQVKAG